jgi:hypothetical protein
MLHVRICAGVSGDWHPYRDPERRCKGRNGKGRPHPPPQTQTQDPVEH